MPWTSPSGPSKELAREGATREIHVVLVCRAKPSTSANLVAEILYISSWSRSCKLSSSPHCPKVGNSKRHVFYLTGLRAAFCAKGIPFSKSGHGWSWGWPPWCHRNTARHSLIESKCVLLVYRDDVLQQHPMTPKCFKGQHRRCFRLLRACGRIDELACTPERP